MLEVGKQWVRAQGVASELLERLLFALVLAYLVLLPFLRLFHGIVFWQLFVAVESTTLWQSVDRSPVNLPPWVLPLWDRIRVLVPLEKSPCPLRHLVVLFARVTFPVLGLRLVA